MKEWMKYLIIVLRSGHQDEVSGRSLALCCDLLTTVCQTAIRFCDDALESHLQVIVGTLTAQVAEQPSISDQVSSNSYCLFLLFYCYAQHVTYRSNGRSLSVAFLLRGSSTSFLPLSTCFITRWLLHTECVVLWQVLSLLRFLVIENPDNRYLRRAIPLLEPFPDQEAFAELRAAQHALKYSSGAFTLRQVLPICLLMFFSVGKKKLLLSNHTLIIHRIWFSL